MSDDKNPNGPFFDAFRTFGKSLSLPQMTIEDIVTHNRRNIQAMEKAAKNATESATAIMAQQRKALEDALADVTHMVQDARDGGLNKDNARDILADQTEFAKRTFETTVRNATEMGDILAKTGRENTMIFKERLQEGLEEAKDIMDRKKSDDN